MTRSEWFALPDAQRTWERWIALPKAVRDKIATKPMTKQLIGLEGRRVEVTTPDGEKRRFYVGVSTGWAPVHLEIKRSDSTGGLPVHLPEGSTIRVIR